MLKKERPIQRYIQVKSERERERKCKKEEGNRQENRNRAKEREEHFFLFRDNFSYCGARQKWSWYKKIDEESWPVLYPFRTFIVKMGLIKFGQGVGLPFSGLNLSIAARDTRITKNKLEEKAKTFLRLGKFAS